MSAFQIENFRLTAALALAERGWPVFPVHHPRRADPGGAAACSCREQCGSIGKHPRTQHGLKEATTDPAAIVAWWRKWPEANVGLATGPASGLLVIDIDPDKGGSESFAEVFDTHGDIPETVEVQTGGGGRHIYLAYPAGVRVANSSGKIGPGIDVRGDGGYVVAPPSLHRSGGQYGFVDGPAAGQLPPDRSPCPAPDWLLSLLVDRVRPSPVNRPQRPNDDAGRHWLGKALARTVTGARNETGLWLATQLRDAGLSLSQAEPVMRDYAQRCPAGDPPYTEREALASVRSAYTRPAREPAHDPAKMVVNPGVSGTAPPKLAVPITGAAAELSSYLGDIAAHRAYDVGWPWPQLSSMTQSLIPGTVTCIVGDPGTAKTFMVLQSLLHWIANGHDAAVFFVEKDRKFHTMRLLAQLESSGNFVNYEWLANNGPAVERALARHRETIDLLGRHIASAPLERVTLDSMLAWVRQQASAGKRVMVIDPITAVAAGDKRWEADDTFVMEAQSILTAHGASLVLVTHSKKGNRPGAASGHDMAGGAAYHRFTDTTIWLHRARKPKRVQYRTSGNLPAAGTFELFFQLHKTRHAKGAGKELAYTFGDELRFAEQGVVTKDLPDEQQEAA